MFLRVDQQKNNSKAPRADIPNCNSAPRRICLIYRPETPDVSSPNRPQNPKDGSSAMQRRSILVAVAIATAVAACFLLNLSSPQAAYQREAQFTRWEYRLVSITDGTREFNRLGADGWELCACTGAGSPQGVLFFKRPVP
jgi:hypothetical protein